MRQDRIEVLPGHSAQNAVSTVTGHAYPLGRSQAVTHFIHATDTLSRWRRQSRWHVVELGFGAGINFLETLLAWRAYRDALPSDQQMRTRLGYTCLVDLPLTAAQAAILLRTAGFDASETGELLRQWPEPIAGFHRCRFTSGVELTLVYGPIRKTLPELTGIADSVYLNSFAAASADRPVFSALWRLCSAQCRIAGDFHAASTLNQLSAAGFRIVERSRGFAGHMHRQPNRRDAVQPLPDERTIAVVGAGIAGLSIAREMAMLGWHVELIEKNDLLLQGGSSQPVLAAHQHLSPDDNPLSRLTRAAQILLRDLPGATRSGRLHLASGQQHLSSQQHLLSQQQMLDRLDWPETVISSLNVEQASDVAGMALRTGGIWQPGNHQIDPLAVLRALPDSVAVHRGTEVARIMRRDQRWLLSDNSDKTIAEVSRVVVCTAEVPANLLPAKTIKTQILVGQSSILADTRANGLHCVLGGHAYACPIGDGTILTGASYRQLPAVALRDDDQINRRNWLQLVAGQGSANILASHVGVRHGTVDRLPIIGPVPDEHRTREHSPEIHRDDRMPIPSLPGVFLACGFGSRGALWAPLAASVLANQLDGGCLPIENTLAAAISPHRFARRAIRHGHLI